MNFRIDSLTNNVIARYRSDLKLERIATLRSQLRNTLTLKNWFMHKLLFTLVAFLITGLSYSQSPSTLNVMPVPASIEIAEGQFIITKDFAVSIEGTPDDRIYSATTRFLVRLKNRTGIFINQGLVDESANHANASLRIIIDQPGVVEYGENESYTISVTTNGIALKASTDIGALRGLETILQLVTPNADGYYIPTVQINDSPRFPWRGLMIDVARHFHSVGVIKRNIDGMAAVKMNVLHLHLSDDQGFRVESKLYPELTNKGSDGLFFTQDQIRDIVEYADQRGIRVYPEFDVPGHATAILTAYPEYATKDTTYTIERWAGIFDPTLDASNPETYVFLNNLFTEMADLFKDEYFHIGGDENEGKHWDESKSIQKFMKKNKLEDNHALQAYFNTQLLVNLEKQGKNMVGWDEINHPDLPKTAVIQSWRGLKFMEKSAKAGYKTLLSNGYYIDLLHSVDEHYLVDPLPDSINLTENEKKNIIGGEATQWSELTTELTIDSRIWPRTAAIAERFWSPQYVRNIEDMRRRMAVVSIQLEQLGLQHNAMQDIILRGMIQGTNIEPLKVLTSVCQPLQGYARNPGGGHYLSYSPYMLFADACIADPAAVYPFNNLVKGYLDGKTDNLSAISEYLSLWKLNHKEFKKLEANAPVLSNLSELSNNLSVLAITGQEALLFASDNNKPSKDWIENSKTIVSNARKQGGRAELQIVDAIELLIANCQE